MASHQTPSPLAPPLIRADWLRAPISIGGSDREANGYSGVYDPAHPAVEVGVYAQGGADDVDVAVRAAQEAAESWGALTGARRAELIAAVADAIEEHAEKLADLVTLEVGKVRHEAVGDVRGGVGLLRSFAALAPDALHTEDITGRPGTRDAQRVLLGRRPVGPVAVISPWNTPVYLALNCIAPALAAGCPVVVKPSEEAPLALTAALRIAARVLPPGVIGVVPGTGREAGDALTRHPGIRAVLFTGGTVTGRAVIAATAQTVKKVAMELGGNDPAIVLSTASITEAMVRELVAGTFAVSGQVCFNVKRIYVHRSRYDEFVAAYTDLVDQIVVGEGFDPRAQMGPLTTRAGYERALAYLQDCRERGADVRELGRLAASGDGYFIRPTVVTGIAPDAPLVLEEQFAPIVPILPFDDDDDAIREANRTEFGLASSVWSDDLEHAVAVASRIEAGNTFINAHRVGASVAAVPFGGVKQSGLGRNHSLWAVHECTEEHAIVAWSDASAQVPGIDLWSDLRFTEKNA